MITKERVQALIELGNEDRNLDYKGAFSWSDATGDEKCGIVKDVLAFSNTRDGGTILVGVNDKSGALEGLTDEQSASFDQTKFNNFLQRYTAPRHTANVYRLDIGGKRVVAIDIPEFSEVPILCARDANNSANKSILKRAALYMRTDRATSEAIEDAEAMRELLNRGLIRRQDELFRAFKEIIQPRETTPAAEPGSEYKGEIQEAEKYFSEFAALAGNSARWTVEMRPEIYIPGRLQSAAQVQSAVQQSAIGLRGWTFPIAGRLGSDRWVNFDGGSQSTHESGVHSPEALRVYKSGMVIWRTAAWEDYWEAFANQGVTSFIGLIYATTEWLLFARRFFESLLSVDESVHLTVSATGIQGRKLISADPRVAFYWEFRAGVSDFKIEETAPVTELRADPEAIARRIVKRIFELYNWNNPEEQMITSWQQRLIQRQF